ncbi:MAG TPA: class A beta-lactamase [Microvirga sp.]|nr:class A beta-lactamase [Microvirga sp.]
MATRRRFMAAAGASALTGMLVYSHSAAQTDWIDGFDQRLAAIEARYASRLGVTVLDTATGRRISHRGGERFPMCSTFKTLAAAAVLRRVDAGQESLDRRIRFAESDLVTYSPVTKDRVASGMTLAELCEATTTISDNTAANLILKALGGPSAVTDLARSVGDAQTRLDRWETALNEGKPGDPRDTTTPDAMASTLRAFALDGALSSASRELFNGWLIGNKTDDAKLRAGLPKGWRVGDKTGAGGNGTTNDIAVIWPPGRAPVVVTMFMTETALTMAQTNPAFAEVGRLVATALEA